MTTYIAPLNEASAAADVAATLKAIRGELGMVPNLYATLAKAPSTLKAMLAIDQANTTGRLTAIEREIVSLAASQVNGCQYCLSAHMLLSQKAGLSAEQARQARAGQPGNSRYAAIAAFTKAVVEHRGHVETKVLDGFKAAGLGETDMLEIIANVAAMTLSNFANNVARTEIDFPVVDVAAAA
jgi:uncharacterized peroxidase-related enzyme